MNEIVQMDSTFTNLEDLIRQAGLTNPFTTHGGKEKEKEKKKPKFLLVSTHIHQTTGYSKVTYHILKELAKRNVCDIYHFGIQKFMVAPEGYRQYPEGIQVYDPALKEKNKEAETEMGFGYSQLPDYVRSLKPDIVLIYNDAAVITQYMNKLETIPVAERTYKLMVYLDQVYTIQRPELLARIDRNAHTFFVFTKYWKDILEKQGIQKPIHVLRHGFDSTQFRQLDRLSIRLKHGIPENAFVFLNVNRNTPRKRYDIVVTAFAELIARHPAKQLLFLAICDNGESGGYPIQEIFLRELTRLSLPIAQHAQKFMISKSSMTYTDELINELYSLSDVGITAAEGEGFGLCQFEAMGVGIPQVVPLVGGFRDYCVHGFNSQVVPTKWRSYLALSQCSVGGMAEYVSAFDLSLAAEEYLLDSDLRELHGKRARETVLAYTWASEIQSLVDVISKENTP